MKEIPEHFLLHIWEGMHLNQDELITADGKKIEIMERGFLNSDSGPDFKNAILKINGIILSGDVEIHRFSSDWKLHKHFEDTRYNNVILHLVMWKNNSEETFRQDGQKVPMLILSDFIEGNIEKLLKKLEDEEMSLKKLSELDKIKELPKEEIISTLLQAGEKRLMEKVEKFRERALQVFWEQLLFEGIMESLGYSKNQEPFLKLAQKIPVEFLINELSSTEEIQTVMFGSAGLLPYQVPGKMRLTPEAKEYSKKLETLWKDLRKKLPVESILFNEWQFFRMRPQNFPTVRLAGMSFLIFKYSKRGIFSGIYEVINKIAKPEELEKALFVKANGFWTTHYNFSGTAHKPNTILIGKDRIRDIIINIVVPIFILYSERTKNSELKDKLLKFYKEYPPASENEITRAVKSTLLNDIKIKSSAQLQQGMIEIFKTYYPRSSKHV